MYFIYVIIYFSSFLPEDVILMMTIFLMREWTIMLIADFLVITVIGVTANVIGYIIECLGF